MNKEQLFKQTYEQSKDKIYRLCLGFAGNNSDADDLFQEVFIKVWNNLETFRNESSINTWIYKIATNTALLYVSRKNKFNKRISYLKPEDLNLEIKESDPSYTELEFKKLYQAISELKERDRIIISLLFENSSYSEISEIVGLSVSNVGVRINRIKKTLTKKLK
ncbi:MAG TPA: RNA polymerase sigma factor [Ignavibacteria bacterium]|nr:RNA polymerase sigma factor [Ignavibacteria bacterium]